MYKLTLENSAEFEITSLQIPYIVHMIKSWVILVFRAALIPGPLDEQRCLLFLQKVVENTNLFIIQVMVETM